MSIEVTWLIPDQMLLGRWIGDVVPDDMRVVLEELTIILNEAHQPIHTVIDLSQAIQVNPGVVDLYVQSGLVAHAYHGHIAVVGASFDDTALGDLLKRLARAVPILLCKSRTEARDYLLSGGLPPARPRTNNLPPSPPESRSPKNHAGPAH